MTMMFLRAGFLLGLLSKFTVMQRMNLTSTGTQNSKTKSFMERAPRLRTNSAFGWQVVAYTSKLSSTKDTIGVAFWDGAPGSSQLESWHNDS